MTDLNPTFSTPSKRQTRFEPTEHFSERKRALFPTQSSDSDSDLGHISPLECSLSPKNYDAEQTDNEARKEHCYFNSLSLPGKILSRKCSTLFERINDENEGLSKILAPNTPTPLNSPVKYAHATQIPETPTKVSPTQILKTPHDSSNIKTQIPRLVRKSLLDTASTATNLKRKSDSPDTSLTKHMKLDTSLNKAPKARTALFTDSIFPAKSFYPKMEPFKRQQNTQSFTELSETKRIPRKPPPVFLCNRARYSRSKHGFFGQINAGVRHSIRKPKHKSGMTKTQLLKAALNIVKNSPLNEYLGKIDGENVGSVSQEQMDKMDAILRQMQSQARTQEPEEQQISQMDSILNNLEICLAQTQPVKPEQKSHASTSKRALSPQPDPTKKFFKCGHSRATVTITNTMKLKYENGDVSLIKQPEKVRKVKHNPSLDFSFNDDGKLLDESVTDILNSLNDTTEPAKPTVTQPMLLSPTSLVCDMTSGLALDSPKNDARPNVNLDKLNASKKKISFNDTDKKLFPIFNRTQNLLAAHPGKESRHEKNIRKIWKPLIKGQAIIDAGQKRFGAIQCPECKFLYSAGEPEDEILHYNYHNNVGILKYNGWKQERIVNEFNEDKIIEINSQDPKRWWCKVRDVIGVVNQELGCTDIPIDATSHVKVFLYISNKQIVGCIITEPKALAHRFLQSGQPDTTDCCSVESYPVKCGISRIWVAAPYRRRGVASRLLDTTRYKFMYGYVLTVADIAFSVPTEAGKQFASKYTKANDFLIYTE